MRLPGDILEHSWFLAGPTACGKSDAGIELALRVSGEVLSLDSMAVYRGMNIGTAKPSDEMRKRVPHHLIDLVDAAQSFSVAGYLAAAERACVEVISRGNAPVFVGGTGLYLRSLLRGVFEGPLADAAIRSRLEAEADRDGGEALLARLHAVDPVTAAKLHANDRLRIVRALEVLELTGRPISELRQQPPRRDVALRAFWLSPPRAWLYGRIDRRVERMFAEGLVDEVRSMTSGPRGLSCTAMQGLGYKEVVEHLAGRMTLAETIAAVQTRTRQFAKRQHTWFRNLEECREVKVAGDETPAEVGELILRSAALSA